MARVTEPESGGPPLDPTARQQSLDSFLHTSHPPLRVWVQPREERDSGRPLPSPPEQPPRSFPSHPPDIMVKEPPRGIMSWSLHLGTRETERRAVPGRRTGLPGTGIKEQEEKTHRKGGRRAQTAYTRVLWLQAPGAQEPCQDAGQSPARTQGRAPQGRVRGDAARGQEHRSPN